MRGSMTEEMLKTIVEAAGAELGSDGTASLPDGHLLTLHLAHDGVSLSVGRIVRLSVEAGTVRSEDDKGELFVGTLADAFAATISVPKGGSGRKAGFIR